MNNESIEFVLTTVMILLTLGAAYGGLRLVDWNWKRRMAVIAVPMLINALLFFLYSNDNFLYLGLILLVCLPFVWPRKSA